MDYRDMYISFDGHIMYQLFVTIHQQEVYIWHSCIYLVYLYIQTVDLTVDSTGLMPWIFKALIIMLCLAYQFKDIQLKSTCDLELSISSEIIVRLGKQSKQL